MHELWLQEVKLLLRLPLLLLLSVYQGCAAGLQCWLPQLCACATPRRPGRRLCTKPLLQLDTGVAAPPDECRKRWQAEGKPCLLTWHQHSDEGLMCRLILQVLPWPRCHAADSSRPHHGLQAPSHASCRLLLRAAFCIPKVQRCSERFILQAQPLQPCLWRRRGPSSGHSASLPAQAQVLSLGALQAAKHVPCNCSSEVRGPLRVYGTGLCEIETGQTHPACWLAGLPA